MEPRAADRRIRRRQRSLHALHDQPEPARRPAGAVGLHRHRARAQAARHRAGCGRRLRLQDLHLRRGDRLRVGGQEGRPAGQVDGDRTRGLPGRRAWPRPRHPCRARDRRRRQDPGAAGQHQGQSRRLSLDLLVLGADLSLCAAAVRPVRYPGHLLRGRRASTPTPRPSMPIAAPAGRRRPSWSSGWSRWRRAQLGQDPAEFRRQNFIKSFPHQTPVIMAYDAGDYAACLDKALEMADYKGIAARKAASAAKGAETRHRLLGLHRGLRHRAERRR